MKNHRLRETVSDVTTTFWERSNYNLMSVASSAADVEQMARSLKPRPLFMIRLCPAFCASPCRSVIAKYACLAHTLWTLVKCGANSRINGFTVHSSTWLIVSSSRVSGTEFYILRSEAKWQISYISSAFSDFNAASWQISSKPGCVAYIRSREVQNIKLSFIFKKNLSICTVLFQGHSRSKDNVS